MTPPSSSRPCLAAGRARRSAPYPDGVAEQAKRQHYVSKFLLRRFTDDLEDEKKGCLFRLDTKTGKPERASVLNEAVIGHYYTFMRRREDGTLERDVSVENDLADREAVAAEHVRRVFVPGARLDADERLKFAEFIHLSRQRTPLARAWLRYQSDVLEQQWREVYGTEPTGLPDSPEELEFQMMYMALPQVAPFLASAFTWTLLRAPAGTEVVIADTPTAIVDAHFPRELGLSYGSSLTTETTFPLDPRLCLLLKLGEEPWVEREASPSEVDDMNLRSYAWAQHSIYGASQAAVTTVRAVAKANRHKLARYAPRSGKLWFGEEVDGREVWEGFSAAEAGVKPAVRR